MTKVFISDHALLRWLERVHDIDVEHHRSIMEKLAQPFVDVRAFTAEIGGVWFRFADHRVVTVLPDRPRANNHLRNDMHHANGTDRNWGDTKGRSRRR